MDQQPAQPSTTPAAAPAAPEAKPSGMEKVYKDFGIEDQANSFQPQSPTPAATPAPAATPKIPVDPFAPDFALHQEKLAHGVSVLTQAQGQAFQKLDALEKRIQQRETEADIKQAVGVIAEKSGIEPDIAEVALEARARSDPKFLALWNQRHKNPKALSAALQALSGEFKDRFAVKQDPQLVENQRAVKASQQQMATTAARTANDEWADMSPSDRQRRVQALIKSG